MAERSPTLSEPRFWLMDGGFGTYEKAFAAAEDFVGSRLSVDRTEPLSVIGDFIIPPLDGPASRDFQTLHFDFGLPLDPKMARDVARYTALYIAPGDGDVTAVTRLVPLVPLLSQRDWPERRWADREIRRLRSDPRCQGRSHGLFRGKLRSRHRRGRNKPTASRKREDRPGLPLRNGVRHLGCRKRVLPAARPGRRGRSRSISFFGPDNCSSSTTWRSLMVVGANVNRASCINEYSVTCN